MLEESEIKALIHLLDDTDQEVFDHVSKKIISLGPQIIDQLESAYTSIPNPMIQERIEDIIHLIQFDRLQKDLLQWCQQDQDKLLQGLLIITRHQFPDLQEEKILKFFAQTKRDIYLGMHHYLSPLEQMNLINQTLFHLIGIKGNNKIEADIKSSYVNQVIETSKGNHFSVGLIYLIVCQQLEIPVYGVRLSSHFILVRTKDYIVDFENTIFNRNEILFYLNPYNKGLAFSEKEISQYLKKINVEPIDKYYAPSSNKEVLKEYVLFLIKLYAKPNEQWKVEDLRSLYRILQENA